MDQDTTDAAWNQQEQDERRRLEDELLDNDPEYQQWLEMNGSQPITQDLNSFTVKER